MKGQFYQTLQEIGKGFDGQAAFLYRENGCVKKVSYPEFMRFVTQRAGYYAHMQQKRIGIWASNSYEWIVNAAAMLLAGKTVIFLDVYLKEEDLDTLTDYTDAELIMADGELINSLKRRERKITMEPLNTSGEEPAFKENIAEGEFICFTSGTASSAKGVVVLAETLAKAVDAGVVAFPGEAKERFLLPIPYYHIYGFTHIFHILKRGGTVCIGQSRYLGTEIKEYQPQIAILVPSMVRYIVKHDLLQEPLHAIVTGGAMPNEEVMRQIEEKGIRLENVYGLSETLGEISMSMREKGFCWQRPQEGVRFVRSPEGEIGIYLPFHMSGYYKKPEDTAAVLDSQINLFWTGDAGEIDGDGCVRIRGRLRDTIVMENGEKIHAEDMDEQISGIEGVKEAAVIGFEGKLGVVLVYEKECDRERIENEVKRINRENATFVQIVKIWMQNKPLPRTSTGKLKRYELEKEYRTLR